MRAVQSAWRSWPKAIKTAWCFFEKMDSMQPRIIQAFHLGCCASAVKLFAKTQPNLWHNISKNGDAVHSCPDAHEYLNYSRVGSEGKNPPPVWRKKEHNKTLGAFGLVLLLDKHLPYWDYTRIRSTLLSSRLFSSSPVLFSRIAHQGGILPYPEYRLTDCHADGILTSLTMDKKRGQGAAGTPS